MNDLINGALIAGIFSLMGIIITIIGNSIQNKKDHENNIEKIRIENKLEFKNRIREFEFNNKIKIFEEIEAFSNKIHLGLTTLEQGKLNNSLTPETENIIKTQFRQELKSLSQLLFGKPGNYLNDDIRGPLGRYITQIENFVNDKLPFKDTNKLREKLKIEGADIQKAIQDEINKMTLKNE